MKGQMRTLTLVLFLLMGACEQRADVGDLAARDGGVPNPPQTPTEQVTAFCQGFYQRICEASEVCCDQPARIYDTVALCVNDESPRCVRQLLGVEAISDGALVIDQAALPDFYRALEVEQDSCLARAHAPPLRGTLASGADCSYTDRDLTFSRACQGNLTCIVDRTEATNGGVRYVGHCGAVLAEGASCVVTEGGESGCGGDRFCNLTCQPRRVRGESCTGSQACVLGLACNAGFCGSESGIKQDPDYYCLRSATPCANYPLEPTTDGCNQEWQCSGRHRVECTATQAGGSEYDCRCFTDTIPGATFTSQGYCGADQVTRAAAARAGCGFPI